MLTVNTNKINKLYNELYELDNKLKNRDFGEIITWEPKKIKELFDMYDYKRAQIRNKIKQFQKID